MKLFPFVFFYMEDRGSIPGVIFFFPSIYHLEHRLVDKFGWRYSEDAVDLTSLIYSTILCNELKVRCSLK